MQLITLSESEFHRWKFREFPSQRIIKLVSATSTCLFSNVHVFKADTHHENIFLGVNRKLSFVCHRDNYLWLIFADFKENIKNWFHVFRCACWKVSWFFLLVSNVKWNFVKILGMFLESSKLFNSINITITKALTNLPAHKLEAFLR